MVSNRVRVSIWAISSLNYCFCCFVLVANLRCHLASNFESVVMVNVGFMVRQWIWGAAPQSKNLQILRSVISRRAIFIQASCRRRTKRV